MKDPQGLEMMRKSVRQVGKRSPEDKVDCSIRLEKVSSSNHQTQNGRPERVGNRGEVSRSVRKNRVMKDENLQKGLSDKAKIKM
jgi:hypothetical protein